MWQFFCAYLNLNFGNAPSGNFLFSKSSVFPLKCKKALSNNKTSALTEFFYEYVAENIFLKLNRSEDSKTGSFLIQSFQSVRLLTCSGIQLWITAAAAAPTNTPAPTAPSTTPHPAKSTCPRQLACPWPTRRHTRSRWSSASCPARG